MSKLVLQINSIDVLERLIGGDSEIELTIRNNIVQNFAKKHLKEIAEQVLGSERQKFTDVVHTKLAETAANSLGEYRKDGYYSSKLVLRSDIKQLIEQLAAQKAATVFSEEFEKRLTTEKEAQENRFIRILSSKVRDAVDVDFEKRVSAEIEVRLKKIRESI